MSDLAPFLAAAGLRDKVVLDLQEENDRLKAELVRLNTAIRDSRRDVEITGPSGFPLYANGDYRRTFSGPKFANPNMLLDLEIHICGDEHPITFREIAQGNWTCYRPFFYQYCLIEAAPGNDSAFRSLHLSCRDASEEQLETTCKYLNDGSESNLKAFEDINWTSSSFLHFTDFRLSEN